MNIHEKIKQLKTNRDATQKEVDKVLSKRSTGSRARAAYDLWLRLNPTHRVGFDDGSVEYLSAKQIHDETVRKVKQLRLEQNNSYGTNESGSMRIGLELPPHAMLFMKMFHPDIFDDDEHAKTRFRKLIKEFREFQVMEKI